MRKLIITLALILSFSTYCKNKEYDGNFYHIITNNNCNKVLQESYKVDTLDLFKNKMAFLESSNRPQAVNSFGYLGKYQFSKKTLRGLNFKPNEIDSFLIDENLQERAMDKLVIHNTRILKNYGLDKFIGKEVNGITITMRGMLAGSHLTGPYSVKEYVMSNGEIDRTDGYGTPVSKYIKSFEEEEDGRGEY